MNNSKIDFSKPKIILFVCSGNTCRSPMAKALFDYQSVQNKLENFIADSAGANCFPNQSASENAQLAMQELNINTLKDHRSKPLSKELIEKAHIIFCMTNYISDLIKISVPNAAEKIISLCVFENTVSPNLTVSELSKQSARDITDPFAGNIEIYRRCRDQINNCVINIIEYLKNQKP